MTTHKRTTNGKPAVSYNVTKGNNVSDTNPDQLPPTTHNADATDIALSEARDHLDANALIAATNTYELVASGASGYAAAKELARTTGLTPDLFAAWRPDDPKNRVEQFIRELHNLSGSKDRFEIREEMSAALHAAVCASAKDIATKAREGQSDATDPNLRAKISAVRAQVYSEDAGGIASQAAAAALLAKRLKETASDPERLAIWQQASAAVDQLVALRRMGNDLGAMQTNSTRWRAALYLPLVAGPLDKYSDHYGSDKIGGVVAKALSTARKAHKDYIKSSVDTGNADKMTGDGLVAAVHAALDKDVIGPATTIGGKVKSDLEVMRDVNARLWKLLAKVDELWSTNLTTMVAMHAATAKIDVVSDDIPVALNAKSADNQEKREGAEDNVRSHNKGAAGAASGKAAQQSAEKQAEREGKAAAGAAASTQPSSTKARLANLKTKTK